MVKKSLSVLKSAVKNLKFLKNRIDRPAKNVYDVKTIIVRSGCKILKIVRVIRQFPCEQFGTSVVSAKYS